MVDILQVVDVEPMVAEAEAALGMALEDPIYNAIAAAGKSGFSLRPKFFGIIDTSFRYGHMSRDCTQGSKCYNCTVDAIVC
jgi:hypothetical protein